MKAFITFLIFFISFTVLAKECKNKPFYNDHEKGWFYKKLCEELQKKDTHTFEQKKIESNYKTLQTTVVKIPWNNLDKLDPDEIQKIYEKAKKIAVMYPTKHNVREFQKLNIWIQEKSFAFMEQTLKVVRTDPYLSAYASKIPVSTVARTTFLQDESRYRKKILRQFKDRAGLVVAVKQGCPYCERQKQILKWFSEETGFPYKLVDIHKYPNFTRKMSIVRVPDIFLVVKTPQGAKWIRIATGLHTQLELEKLIIFGLYNLGLIHHEDKNYILY